MYIYIYINIFLISLITSSNYPLIGSSNTTSVIQNDGVEYLSK